MSTTAPTSTAATVARDLTDLYTLVVHESPEVCATCHRRIRAPEHATSGRAVKTDRLQAAYEANHLGTGDDELAPLRRGGDGTAGYDVEDIDRYGAQRRYYIRTYCEHCGQPGDRTPADTLSKAAMLDAVDPLVARFDERDIPLNADRLKQAVGHLRSQPEYQARTTDIWRAAVAVAARHARPRDCVRCSSRSHR